MVSADEAAELREVARTDVDGRRLAARIFHELGLADGALVVPRLDAELAVAIAGRFAWDFFSANADGQRHCRVCGCTEFRACRGPDGPCSWVEPDLCSVCAAFPEPTL